MAAASRSLLSRSSLKFQTTTHGTDALQLVLLEVVIASIQHVDEFVDNISWLYSAAQSRSDEYRT
jgi:hypothetical protein